MSSATLAPSCRADEIHGWKPSSLIGVLLVIVYLSAWTTTRAHFMADTNVYTQAILAHQHGKAPVEYRSSSNPFWDFGHLLWRPLGWIFFPISRPLARLFYRGGESAQVTVTLIAINFSAGAACVLFLFRLVRRFTGNYWAALCVALGLIFADAFLNYVHSGSPYVVALAFLLGGMYFAVPRQHLGSSFNTILAAAFMFAMSVFFWLPYAFVLPAAAASPLLVYGNDRDRRMLAVKTLLVTAAMGVVVYASVAAAIGIRGVPQLKDWIWTSGHGQLQPGGLRAFARLAFSVPRSFINMDRDGMLFKRYVLHDPYAPVTFANLFGLSIWKLVLFYVAGGLFFVQLCRSHRGRVLVLILAAATVPIFIFALFIFEAGSIERYMPLYPFVLVALSWVLADAKTNRVLRLGLMSILIIVVAVNLNAMRVSRVGITRTAAVTRIQELLPILRPRSVLMAVNEQDDLAEFCHDFPLDPINIEAHWQSYNVLEINAERLATWREDFARQVSETWRQDGEVWLPERVFQMRPRPEWNWVEGDDKRVRWTDLPAFFSQFETAPAIGGDDGFVLLPKSDKNQQQLKGILRQ